MTAFGDVRVLRQPLVRLVATVLLIGVGLWIFYVGIRHVVAD
jgi:ABC-type nickel/cobalt efflux system permease component RcnA